MRLHPLVRALFWPASLLFGGIVRLRAWAYRHGILKQKQLKGVVISVGNLTVGGTGKTPMVLWLAERLHAQDKRVGILIRGYRGWQHETARLATIDAVAPASDARLTSDEVLLLAKRLGQMALIGAGPERYAHGLQLEKMGVEWFVLDDGFQHMQLARDVDIVLIDSTDPFGGGLLPAGRLREPPSALARADLIVITRAEHSPAIETIIRRYSPAPVFYATTYLERVRPLEASRAEEETPAWLGKKVFAFCGIGNPAAFFDDVRHWGMDVVGQMPFRDHFQFTQYDADQIEQRAKACGAEALVCTEKDTYNLAGVRFATLPAYSCNVSLRIAQEEEFWKSLLEILERRRGANIP